MTREDIIHMAMDAGFGPAVKWDEFQKPFLRFAALVAIAENEACAKIGDNWTDYDVCGLVDTIRARVNPEASAT